MDEPTLIAIHAMTDRNRNRNNNDARRRGVVVGRDAAAQRHKNMMDQRILTSLRLSCECVIGVTSFAAMHLVISGFLCDALGADFMMSGDVPLVSMLALVYLYVAVVLSAAISTTIFGDY